MLPRFYKQEVDNRKHQINTLKIFNDNVREIVEDSEYEVFFKSGENNLSLKVTLGTDFPQEKPLLVVAPIVNHPWIDENGVVTTAPGLLNYTPHSDLGRIVQAIIRELQRNPPTLIGGSSSLMPQNMPLKEERQTTTTASYTFSPPHQTSAQNMLQSHQNRVYLDLTRLSVKDLRFLYESEDGQAEFIEELPVIKEQHKELEALISQVEDIAEDNLKKEEELENLREMVDVQMEEVAKLAFENERLYFIYENLSGRYSPRNIQEELAKAAKVADENSDTIAESFLKGNLEIEKFLNSFIKSKALYYLRKTKEEKLCHQLNRLEKAGF